MILLISPITARIKVIFQLLCKEKNEWDDEVTSEVMSICKEFLVALKKVVSIRMKRFEFVDITEEILNIELHGFCDSSSEVYCCMVYLRIVTNLGVKVTVLASKTKVAPH